MVDHLYALSSIQFHPFIVSISITWVPGELLDAEEKKITLHGLCPHRSLTRFPNLNKSCALNLVFYPCSVIPKLRESKCSEHCSHVTLGNWILSHCDIGELDTDCYQIIGSWAWKDQRSIWPTPLFSNEKTETKACRKFKKIRSRSTLTWTQQSWPCAGAIHPPLGAFLSA